MVMGRGGGDQALRLRKEWATKRIAHPGLTDRRATIPAQHFDLLCCCLWVGLTTLRFRA